VVPLRDVSLANAFPVLQGVQSYVGVGYHANIEDSLGFARFGVTAAIRRPNNFDGNQHAHIELTGAYLGWRAALSYNRSDFYDIFGRPSAAAKATPRSSATTTPSSGTSRGGSIFAGPRVLRQDRHAAERAKRRNAFTRLVQGQVGLHYTDVRRSIGAVDDEKGISWSLDAKGSQAQGTDSAAVGHVEPWLSRSFAALVDLAAYRRRGANGDRSNSLANFYFGGFGNNYVDDGPIQRYREYNTLPGSRSTRSADPISCVS
jgi:hypothetical protein